MTSYISENTGKPVTIECRFCRKFTERHVPATRLEGQWAGGDSDIDPQWMPVCDYHAAEWHHDSLTSEPIPVEQRLPSFVFTDDVIPYDLRLSFTPDAIREHFEGDEPDPTEGMTDEQLTEVGRTALDDEGLYRAFHESLTWALDENNG